MLATLLLLVAIIAQTIPLSFLLLLSSLSLAVFFSLCPLYFIQPSLLSLNFLTDEVALFMFLMLFFVFFCSFFFSPQTSASSFSLLLMLLCCWGLFSTSNLLMLYFLYEASLVPILYIILKWGSYPERSMSAIMLLGYTALFTLPFMYVLYYLYSMNHSFLATPFLKAPSSAMALLAFLCFAVKLPAYGLHFWLPMAHVEAPTFGSMLLAGVLLKLGGVGLLRTGLVIPLFPLSEVMLSYSMVSLLFSTLICCLQSDFKRLVAYSSVSHMMAVIPLIILGHSSSVQAASLILLFHGLTSPLLFSIVGISYSWFSTRQLSFLRGALISSPLLAFISSLGLLYSISAPPFPSFVSEVMFMLCSVSFTSWFYWPLVFFAMLSLVYSLSWYSSLLFSASQTSSAHWLAYSQALPLFLMVFSSGLFLAVLSLTV